jgi:hypothetical protein
MSLQAPGERIVVPSKELGEFLNNLDGLTLPEWLKLGELGLTLQSLIDGDANEQVVPWAAWVWARRNVEPGLAWGSDRVFIPLASD